MTTDLTAEPKCLPEFADALLKQILAFGSTTTVYSGTAIIDLHALTSKGIRPGNIEIRVSTPDVAVGSLANAATLKVSLMGDTVSPIDASSTILAADCISMVGAGGVGDKGQYFRYRLSTQNLRFLGLKIVTSADATVGGQAATIEVLA